MANSKYEYVKSFEEEDEVMLPNLIVVRIKGRNFRRFSDVHKFEKPNDEKALNLMNTCAAAILEEYPDIVFSYGFRDEYSFVFKKKSAFYKRRASKILSVVVSLFSSVYVTKWKDYFPQMELRFPPSFQSRIITCASMEVLQAYLTWRQNDCHVQNQCNTCLWMLIKCGKSEREAQEVLKGTGKQEKNELLFQQFGINYKKLPPMFRQGSCVLRRAKRCKSEVEDIDKYKDGETLVKSPGRNVILVHSGNIASGSFWSEHSCLLKELGSFEEDINKVKPEYVKSFEFERKLLPSTWIVVRIDGRHFHGFSEEHEFEKPNDGQALNLMNSCAVAVMEEFKDVVFSYGVSDEFSFVLKRDSQFHDRHASGIVSVIVSFFSSMYVMKWKGFFPQKELKNPPPTFDGRAVCYPSKEILRDYLAWRQVDCHINNQYNTCFWMLVKSGKSKSEAQDYLKGTRAQEKSELLVQQFGIDYQTLPAMFRQGSSVFWDKEDPTERYGDGPDGKSRKKVVVEHCNIIEQSFWEAHPNILDEER
ncbi:tRNA(His) guanylyltransferase 2-like isoform X1 [Rhododendron vialii]|uniref:tRNA(His) guanylyltransferase 2-like isoform X1 n=1 Tax=Rhododendron vialii TaxID=182163 RepID=UPI00266055D3|nr:tRNA(His) guanylyltransferase 2-like isoform X1 [Rhododendron vialii]XP_058186039.1 tRNA(His) guanylyltransferase 2-like isoform X1 [Rhododendron vialii]XP_058186040.1 tRNA(His) guanylyltransferase 2-like isoform X1 [Rhododendron vialii]